MKTRILSSFVGLLILAVVLFFFDTLVLNITIGLLAMIAVIELLKATKLWGHRGLRLLSLLASLVVLVLRQTYVQRFAAEILFGFVLLLFLILLKNHAVLRLEQAAMAFLFSTMVPLAFSCGVWLRDDFGPVAGGFYLLLALGTAWLSDTGAYFTGRRFGKHKLAPVISPKKTVEGAVGGVLSATMLMLLLAWGYSAGMRALGYPLQINYRLLLALTPLYAVIGMLGDLSASVIKRSFAVKDFGDIMPGHGGVMDRFDSVLFTLPTVYVLVQHVELLTVL